MTVIALSTKTSHSRRSFGEVSAKEFTFLIRKQKNHWLQNSHKIFQQEDYISSFLAHGDVTRT